MAGIVRIVKAKSGQVTRPRVSRDDVQMHVPVLILQERIVEVIRLKRGSQQRGHQADLCVELSPLVRRKVDNLLLMPFQYDYQLAEQVLVEVEPDLPMRPFVNDRSQ